MLFDVSLPLLFLFHLPHGSFLRDCSYPSRSCGTPSFTGLIKASTSEAHLALSWDESTKIGARSRPDPFQERLPPPVLPLFSSGRADDRLMVADVQFCSGTQDMTRPGTPTSAHPTLPRPSPRCYAFTTTQSLTQAY